MSAITETREWPDTVTELQTSTPATGGPDGTMNEQATQLAARTQYLRDLAEPAHSLATLAMLGTII